MLIAMKGRAVAASSAAVTAYMEVRDVVLLLVGADLLFVLFHVVHEYTPFLAEHGYSIEAERGFASVFQSVQEFWIAALLFVLAARTLRPVFASWFLLFFYLWMDDWFSIHERLGESAAAALDLRPMFGLRAVDFGELLVSGTAGAILMSLLGLAYLQGNAESRAVARGFALLLAGLVGFGVAGDMLASMLQPSVAGEVLSFVEDGGEMLMMSLICGFALLLSRRSGRLAGEPGGA